MKIRNLLLALYLMPCLATAQVVINEIASTQTLLLDIDGDPSDWIELYNLSGEEISLDGFGLSDDPFSPFKWTFGKVVIAPNEYLLVFASDKERANGEIHTNFKIKSSGEPTVLTSPDGLVQDRIDGIALQQNESFSRFPNGTGSPTVTNAPTPGSANRINNSKLSAPSFDLEPGLYTQEMTLHISHEEDLTVRYTLDGSLPTANSPLAGTSMQLSDRGDEENIYSMIPTNPASRFPLGDYGETDAETRGWLPPYDKVQKCFTVRACSFEGETRGDCTSGSFLIDQNAPLLYNLPVMSIIADPEDLFSDSRGIIVFGNHPQGNYKQRGSAWERPIYLEYFVDGERVISQGASVRVHGGGSRHSAQKNLRIYADGDHGPRYFNFPFFESTDLDYFQRLLVKGGGQRPDCFPRDQIATSIVKHLDISVQKHQSIILFLNGEYWGIHGLKERYDEYYVGHNYYMDPSDVVILELTGQVDEGNDADSLHYQELIAMVSQGEVTPGIYKEVKQQMDTDNYIDYQISEIFLGNGDWPNGNVRYWRKRTEGLVSDAPYGHDGRYRWMFYDLDNAFGGSCNDVFPFFRTLDHATSTSPELEKSTRLLRALLTNEEFKNDFINRFADLLNTIFRAERVKTVIEEINSELRPGLMEHIHRWRYPSTATTLGERATEEPNLEKWDQTIDGLNGYAEKRPDKQRTHLQEYFGLGEKIPQTFDVNDRQMGYIRVNSILLTDEEKGVEQPIFPWTGIYFKGQPFPIQAIPFPGFEFVKWEHLGSDNDLNIHTPITGDTIRAIFKRIDNFFFERQLFINEIMPNNKNNFADPYQEF